MTESTQVNGDGDTGDSSQWTPGTRQYPAPTALFDAAAFEALPNPEVRGAELRMALGRHIAWIASAARLCGYLNARWWQDPATGTPIERNFGELIALMHSELSEALEGHRKGLPDDKLPNRPMVEVELADALIRIFDTADAMGMDLAGAWAEKCIYNLGRADHTHAARLAPGGKKY